MARDKGMSTTEFAQYYQKKRYEYLGLPTDNITEPCGTLMEEMDKLIEVANADPLYIGGTPKNG